MIEHLPGLIAGLLVAAIALLFKRRKSLPPKILKSVGTVADKIKADKIKTAETEHADAHAEAVQEALEIHGASLDALADMANHEFGSD